MQKLLGRGRVDDEAATRTGDHARPDYAYTGHGRLVTALLDEQVHRGLASRRSFCANSQVAFILSARAFYATGGQRCPKVRLPVFRERMFGAKRRAERAGDVVTVIQAPLPASAFLSEQDRLLLAFAGRSVRWRLGASRRSRLGRRSAPGNRCGSGRKAPFASKNQPTLAAGRRTRRVRRLERADWATVAPVGNPRSLPRYCRSCV